MIRLLVISFLVAHAQGSEDGGVDCGGMKIKALRTFLAARGVKCEGCAEKADYVALCEQHKDADVLPPKDEDPSPQEKEKSVEDILGSLKGMPGMENIKMFGADDLKNMNFEQMGNMFGGGGGEKRQTREDYKQRLVEFYQRYGMEDKLDGVEAALDKWKGREEKMFNALNKKYDKEIREHWDNQGSKEEL